MIKRERGPNLNLWFISWDTDKYQAIDLGQTTSLICSFDMTTILKKRLNFVERFEVKIF